MAEDLLDKAERLIDQAENLYRNWGENNTALGLLWEAQQLLDEYHNKSDITL